VTPHRTHTGAHRLLGATLAVVALLVAAPGASAMSKSGSDSVGFGVAPMRYDVDVKPGSSETRMLTINNTDDVATTYTFSKEDFQGDKDDPGATPVLLGGEFASSISGYDWIALPDAVTVPAGGSRTVNVRVTAPSSATGAHYAALIVSGASRSVDELVATSRIGVLFLMNAGGVPPPDIVITEVQEVGPNTTVTKFINPGPGTIKDPSGTITQDPLAPGPDRVIESEHCTETVIAGAAGECTFNTGEGGGGADGEGTLPAGPYSQSLEVVGDGENSSARGELPTEWAGTWTSLLLPLVGISLFALYFLFLRRRRKDGEGDEGDLAWSGSEPLS
jgi:hypothetical protein